MINKVKYNTQNIFLLLLLFISITILGQKKYTKINFKNGNIKAEGWILKTAKVKYWKFYYKNGNVKKEGHFKNNHPDKYWYFYRKDASKEKEGHFSNGKQNDWWLYYDKNGNINHKCQLKDNQKNGYCLLYKNKKLTRASKFKNGKKIKEWDSFSSFKKENKLSDLQ